MVQINHRPSHFLLARKTARHELGDDDASRRKSKKVSCVHCFPFDYSLKQKRCPKSRIEIPILDYSVFPITTAEKNSAISSIF